MRIRGSPLPRSITFGPNRRRPGHEKNIVEGERAAAALEIAYVISPASPAAIGHHDAERAIFGAIGPRQSRLPAAASPRTCHQCHRQDLRAVTSPSGGFWVTPPKPHLPRPPVPCAPGTNAPDHRQGKPARIAGGHDDLYVTENLPWQGWNLGFGDGDSRASLRMWPGGPSREPTG